MYKNAVEKSAKKANVEKGRKGNNKCVTYLGRRNGFWCNGRCRCTELNEVNLFV